MAADTVLDLRGVEVGSRAPLQGMTRLGGGGYRISARDLGAGLHVLGEADVLNAASMLPGVNSVSDYAAGLSVNGAGIQATAVTLDGARVFFPYHFGGIFSTFNTSHIAGATVSPIDMSAATPYVVGGDIAVNTPASMPAGLAGTANVGLLASSVTLRHRLCPAAASAVSARLSYVDRLYGSLLDVADRGTSFSFGDINCTVDARAGSSGAIKANVLVSRDRVGFYGSSYAMDTRLRWTNLASSLVYTHGGSKTDGTHTVAFSSLASHLDMALGSYRFDMPSAVAQFSGHGAVALKLPALDVAYRIEYNRCKPQHLASQPLRPGGSPTYVLTSVVAGVSAAMPRSIHGVAVTPAVNISAYGSGSYRRVAVDPSVALGRQLGAGSLTATIASVTQYMHCVGMGDIGMASDFYLPAVHGCPAERGISTVLGYGWHRTASPVGLDATVYYRRLRHCAEFGGSVLSLLADGYSAYDNIVMASGHDAGITASADLTLGRVSAMASYGYGIGRRRFADTPGAVPSATEPLHTARLLVQWCPSTRLVCTATFVLASGRPYTPVDALYMVGGNVLAEYGPRNSGRLPAYHRLDLSATWRLPEAGVGKVRLRHWVNVSLLNAYGHRNIEMQYFAYDDIQTNTISLNRVSSLYRLLPSISYTLGF